MSWYKYTKTSADDRRAMPLRRYFNKYPDGTVDITFEMRRPGGTFRLTTKNPVSNAYLSGSINAIFIRLKDQGMLTTPAARRTRDRQEMLSQQKNQLENETSPEQKEDKPEEPQLPTQLEFNFSSHRSRLLHRKARVNTHEQEKSPDVQYHFE